MTTEPQTPITEREKNDGLLEIQEAWPYLPELTKWRIYWVLCRNNVFKFLFTFIEINLDRHGLQILVAVQFFVIAYLVLSH